jgi:predicted methyltransferase
MQDPIGVLRNLKARLGPEGRLVIIDFRPDYTGPGASKPSERVRADVVIAEATRAGFRLRKQHHFLPRQYFLEFTPLHP